MFCQSNSQPKVSVMILLISLVTMMAISPVAYARLVSSPEPGLDGGSEGDPLDSNDFAGGGCLDDRLIGIQNSISTEDIEILGQDRPKIEFSSFGIYMLTILPNGQKIVIILPTPEIWNLVEGRYVK